MNRRSAIKLGAGLGVTLGAGFFGGYALLPPSPSRDLESIDSLARRLYSGLDDEQRAETCVSYDDPMRQYHNRGVWGGGRSIMFGFNREQRRMLTDLLYAGLSAEGRARVPKEYFTRWSGVQGLRVLISGDPTSGPYQIILTGTHLNLRLGGRSREGAAFGGPQVYGDQRGDSVAGLPGNLYRDQFLIGQRLLQSLDAGRKNQAVLDKAPVQTQIELQGRTGSFPGIPVSELTPESKALANDAIERIFSTYPAEDVKFAQECIAANGGIDKLCLSYYRHGEGGEIPEGQVFRLEGPAAVLYFRGFPHVHAFINVAMDGDAPLSVGEPLGNNPAWLEAKGVKALFEKALLTGSSSDLAYYEKDTVAGRLRPGTIRSGDIYALESWQDNVEIVQVRGSNLSTEMLNKLREQRTEPVLEKVYSIATTTFTAGEDPARLGRIESRKRGRLLRDVTVDYLKAHPFLELR